MSRLALATVLALGALVVPVSPAAAAVECKAGTTRYIDTPAYALARLAVGRSWSLATGQGVTVAVVDSGVEDANAHLEEAVLRGKSFVPGDDDPTGRTDVWAHGTAIAGIIAARAVEDSAVVGMAPNAKILPVRVFVQEAIEGSAPVPPSQRPDTGRMAAGIRWAAEQGADVINVSMSTSANAPAMRRAVRFAVRQDAVVVASGGNRVSEQESDGPRYPAALPGVIGVAASDESDQVTDFSIHGPQIDVYAPGQNILTTFLGNGDCLIGTDHAYSSYAAGYVSALAALLRERYPDATAEEISYRIMASADRPQRDERDDVRGWGMISPYEALTMTIDPSRPGPPVPGVDKETTTTVAKSVPPITAAPDPLAPVRQNLLWWVLFGGGFVALALLLRPWIGPMVRPAPRKREPMTGEIDVVTADITASADKLRQAAEAVKTTDPSVLVDAIADALSGSSSAAAAWTLEAAWRARFLAWHRDAVAQHDKLVLSAEEYDGSDRLSQSRLASVQRLLGGQVG